MRNSSHCDRVGVLELVDQRDAVLVAERRDEVGVVADRVACGGHQRVERQAAGAPEAVVELVAGGVDQVHEQQVLVWPDSARTSQSPSVRALATAAHRSSSEGSGAGGSSPSSASTPPVLAAENIRSEATWRMSCASDWVGMASGFCSASTPSEARTWEQNPWMVTIVAVS